METSKIISIRTADLLESPVIQSYRIDYVGLPISITEDGERIRGKLTTRQELCVFILEKCERPLLICQLTSDECAGKYRFIDRDGNMKGKLKRPGGHRNCGRDFLRQWIENVVTRSIAGTGEFKVHPLPTEGGQENHVSTGEISRYFTRANTLIKDLTNHDLRDLAGMIAGPRRDAYDDEFGDALPTYKYVLKVNILLIQHAASTEK